MPVGFQRRAGFPSVSAVATRGWPESPEVGVSAPAPPSAPVSVQGRFECHPIQGAGFPSAPHLHELRAFLAHGLPVTRRLAPLSPGSFAALAAASRSPRKVATASTATHSRNTAMFTRSVTPAHGVGRF